MHAPLPKSSGARRSGRSTTVPATVVAAVVLLAGVPGAAAAQTSRDSVAVRAFVQAYRTIWNGHDPSALATFFTEDADMIMGIDPVALGRGAIEGWWRGYFDRQEPERQLAIAVHAVRLITPDVAVLNVVTTTGGRNEKGQALQPRRARGTWVVVRASGSWRISAMRGMPTEQDKIIRSVVR